jgi:hypothetical protein
MTLKTKSLMILAVSHKAQRTRVVRAYVDVAAVLCGGAAHSHPHHGPLPDHGVVDLPKLVKLQSGRARCCSP